MDKITDIDETYPVVRSSHRTEIREEIRKGIIYYEKCSVHYSLVNGVLYEISVIEKGSGSCSGTLKLTPHQAESLIHYFNTEWKR